MSVVSLCPKQPPKLRLASLSLKPPSKPSQFSPVAYPSSSCSSSTTASEVPSQSELTEILPNLYISDINVAECHTTLSSLGITHVLSAMSGTVHIPPNLSIRKLQIPLLDTPFAELAAHLPATTDFLTDALRDKNAKVLVHCVKGVSRSASVISAYLIARHGWTTDQAVNYVQSKRMNAQPNRGFISQLDEYARSLNQSPS